MLEAGMIIELTHGVTHKRTPHIVQIVTEGSARAVPLGYMSAPVGEVPSTMIASISPNSSVKVYSDEERVELLANLVNYDEEGNIVRKRGRKRGSKNAKKNENTSLTPRKRGRPRKNPL